MAGGGGRIPFLVAFPRGRIESGKGKGRGGEKRKLQAFAVNLITVSSGSECSVIM